MITIAICFISSALLLYSISIWSEKIRRGLKTWMVVIFTCAFISDWIGTSIMFCLATTKFQLNLHSCCGYTALIIMGLHLVWAKIALRYHGRTEKYFHRFSVFAWLVWLIAFGSGIPRV
jgi:uncharacterized repeat protein (TIGR03987 family)